MNFRGSYRSKTAIETQTFFKNSYIDLIELNKFYILIIVFVENDQVLQDLIYKSGDN